MQELKNFFTEIAGLLSLLGGAWLAIALFVAGMGLKDENGAGVRNGLLMAAGAALVLAAGITLRATAGAGS